MVAVLPTCDFLVTCDFIFLCLPLAGIYKGKALAGYITNQSVNLLCLKARDRVRVNMSMYEHLMFYFDTVPHH